VSDGQRVTIADIAREAGVSVPTVSKVLNGHAQVSPGTRDKVERLLTAHSYFRRRARPRRSARLIDLVINELDSAWCVEIIRGVEQVVHEAGIGVVVSAVHGRAADARRWLDNLSARGSDGVILAVTELDPQRRREFDALGVPLVVVDPVGNPEPSVPSVGATNWAGGMAATEHLLELGHRRIGMLAGPPEILCSRARLDGYRAALDRYGVRPSAKLVRYGDFHYETGFAGASELLDLPDPPTALFAASDLQALGAYEAVRRHGRWVGQDVSIVGFDDVATAAWSSPPLTTVRQPLAEMAGMAARALLEGVETVIPASMRVELATELVIRESTAPPPGA
jgi:LacI family transcriptional regulator